MKRYFLILVLLLTLFTEISCTPRSVSNPESPQDSDAPCDENLLRFEERRYTYTGNEDDILIEDDQLLIRRAGTYRLSGNLKEGAICVRVPQNESVHLILEGISIQSSYHAPLSIESAACVTLELKEDSVNTFTDASRTKPREEDFLPLSCIEAYTSLLIQGNGTLIIRGRAETALSCSESIRINSGHITLSAPQIALWVRDRLQMHDGSLTVTSAQYGILVSQEEKSAGVLEISGGKLSMVCDKIALSAGTRIEISAGEGSLRAPTLYQCEQKRQGDVRQGSIRITSPDFPPST